MLPTEFYLLNATTLLLWIFQICSHEVLLVLILLGAVCVCVFMCMFVFSVVRFVFRIALDSLDNSFRQILCLSPSELSSRGNLPIIREATDSSNVSDRIGDQPISRVLDRGLNLPQTLALHPVHWAALEGQARLGIADGQVVPNQSEVVNRQRANSSSSASQEPCVIPLRRSRRQRRARCYLSS